MSDDVINKFVDLMSGINVEHPVFDKIADDMLNQKQFEERIKNNPNSIVLYHMWVTARRVERDPDSKEAQAWLNMIKLFLVMFTDKPFWNSRIGWMMWFLSCYVRYDSYYPMKWCLWYDPLNFYMHDEPLRPEGLECPEPDDPFNIKGKCFIHPEWYKNLDTGTGTGTGTGTDGSGTSG